MTNQALPSLGFSGRFDHALGALNDDCTVNRPLLWKQASKKARADQKRGYKDFKGNPFTYRHLFADALQYYRSHIAARISAFHQQREYEAAVAKGGTAKRIAELRLAIEIEAHQKRPNHEKLNAAYRELAQLETVAA